VYKVGSANYHLGIDPAYIRQALRDWASVKRLGENPAARSELVSVRQNQCGYSDSPAGRGLALREVIQEAISALQPEDAKPVMEDKRWRPYLIICEQFQKGRSPDWLCEQMHISRATYYLEQQRALEAITGTLQGWQEKSAAQLAAQRPTIYSFSDEYSKRVFMAPPRGTHPLVGRIELIHEIKQCFSKSDSNRIIALHGLPGVGKTSLAATLAYDPDIQSEFRDGVLWAGLGQQPNLITILGAWAEQLGVDTQIVATRADLEERVNLVRSAIGLRRFLLVIDDAWQIEEALIFKLGGPNCATLLTTRLANLAVEFAGRDVYRVEELSEEDGLALLKGFAPAVVKADPQATRDLVKSVGSLPLALVLMGSYLQVQGANEQPRRIQAALDFLVSQNFTYRLKKAQSPLESHPSLPAADAISLQAVIGLSEAALTSAARNTLYSLSLFPAKPNRFCEKAALRVSNGSTKELDALVDCGLLEVVEADCYQMHQAIHDFAQLKFSDSSAVARMAGFYLQWLDCGLPGQQQNHAELVNVTAACRQAFAFSETRPAFLLVNKLFETLEMQGLYDLAESLLGQAYQAAIDLEDSSTQAELLLKLGDIEVRRGQFAQAYLKLDQAISIAHPRGLKAIEASAWFHRGMARLYSGEIAPGMDELNQALTLARQLESPALLCMVLCGLGFACQEAGLFERAAETLREAQSLAREIGSLRGLGWAHQNLCMLEIQTSQYDLAREDSRACVRAYQEIGDRRGIAWQMYHQGRIDRQTGDYDSAALRFETALTQLEQLGDEMGKGFCVHNLGLLKAELGDWQTAWQQTRRALSMFEKIGCQAGIAQCLHSQAWLARKWGNTSAALQLLEEAIQLRERVYFRRGVGMSWAVYGISMFESGQVQTGLDYSGRAVALFRKLETPASLAYALAFLGRIYVEVGNFEEAVSAYRESVQIRAELNQGHYALEPLAGLAFSAYQLGREEMARQASEEASGLLRQMQMGHTQVIDQPGWVYLKLGQGLEGLGLIENAQYVWRWGRGQICKQAERLPQNASQAAFLKNIPENDFLMQMQI